MTSTALIKDPSPGVTPINGSIIRTDSYNLIVDVLNGFASGSTASIVQPYALKTSNYTLTTSDFLILADASGGAITMTLPDASSPGISGRAFVIQKEDSTQNLVTIATTGGQLIESNSTLLMSIEHDSFFLMSVGTTWEIIAHPGRNALAQLSDNTNQNPTGTSPTKVMFAINDQLIGIQHSAGTGDITVLESGIYLIIASGQFGKLGGTVPVACHLWLRKNGVDVPNSNTSLYLPSAAASTDVLVVNVTLPLVSSDIISVYQSVSTVTDTPGLKVTNPAGEPTIPSIIYSMNKVSL